MNYDDYIDDDSKKKKKKKKDKKEEKIEEVKEEKSIYDKYTKEVEEDRIELNDELEVKEEPIRNVKKPKKHNGIFYNVVMAIFALLIVFVLILLFFPSIIK